MSEQTPLNAWLVSVFHCGPIGEENYCAHIAVFERLEGARMWLEANGYTPADNHRHKKNRGWLWLEPGGGGLAEIEEVRSPR